GQPGLDRQRYRLRPAPLPNLGRRLSPPLRRLQGPGDRPASPRGNRAAASAGRAGQSAQKQRKKGEDAAMIPPPAAGITNYASCRRKTFHSALAHFLQTEFPAIFGPAVTQLFAERVDALYEQFHPPRSRLTFGQV